MGDGTHRRLHTERSESHNNQCFLLCVKILTVKSELLFLLLAKVRTTEHSWKMRHWWQHNRPAATTSTPSSLHPSLWCSLSSPLLIHLLPALADSLFGPHSPVIHSACQSWQQTWDQAAVCRQEGPAVRVCVTSPKAPGCLVGHKVDPSLEGQGFRPFGVSKMSRI